ncbi:MAG: outer membrane beta-barrel protein [Bacteroidota bacterium]
MKTKLLIASLGLCITANAQFSAGLKLNLSSGNIRSNNLVKNLAFQRDFNPKITEWDVDVRWGIGFGLGGFVAYNFSDNFSILAEPTIDFLKCGIDFNRVENKLDNNGDGDIRFESTRSDINLTYFNLPLLARYTFSESKFFLQGGIGINFTGSPTIQSTANVRRESYTNWALDKTTIDASYTLETRLNVFKSPRFNFIFGAGKSFDIKGKDLSIDLRYNLPLTESQMFTTNGNYNEDVFNHNDMLGFGGKLDAENSAPFLLNDFKMSVITLSVSYTLFKKG